MPASKPEKRGDSLVLPSCIMCHQTRVSCILHTFFVLFVLLRPSSSRLPLHTTNRGPGGGLFLCLCHRKHTRTPTPFCHVHCCSAFILLLLFSPSPPDAVPFFFFMPAPTMPPPSSFLHPLLLLLLRLLLLRSRRQNQPSPIKPFRFNFHCSSSHFVSSLYDPTFSTF